MASHQTEHLKLCQWEAEDEVLRVDFNEDNAKIDAAVKAAQDAAAGAYTARFKPFTTGTYTGNGASTRTISVGFTPSAVMVTTIDGDVHQWGSGYSNFYGGLAVLGGSVGSNGLSIVTGGFQVSYSLQAASNSGGMKYNYIAFR